MTATGIYSAGAHPGAWLSCAEEVIHLDPDGDAPNLSSIPQGFLRVGVNLGTATTIVMTPPGITFSDTGI